MRSTSARFRCASWLAIAAMVLNALWPLLANVRPAAGTSLFEICSSAGLRLAPDEDGAPQNAGRHLKPHCALCASGADKAPAAVQAVQFTQVRLPGATELPRTLTPALPVSPNFSPAQPRAPPLFS